MIFEIERIDEDGINVSVFTDAKSLKKVEDGILFDQRISNPKNQFIVYRLNNNLKRIEMVAEYDIAEKDEELMNKVYKSLENIFVFNQKRGRTNEKK